MGFNDTARLRALFAAALDFDGEERDRFIDDACGEDAELRAELGRLLDADAQLIDKTARRVAPAFVEALSAHANGESWAGRRVGTFEVREELGRGGMGVVFRAERVDGTVSQQVAIKFMRRDALDVNARRRFQLERQLLASLDHPYIARLIDAAELDDGTPYYVMEYVDGVPITDYCERRGLGVRERAALMRKVCSAVAEAHRELIVHRDLKPGNILIAADGTPKLLDFGIAKPLQVTAGGAEATGTALRYFSPQYAAPEQLTGAAVGTACDVYALGLLAYELFAGVRPFELGGLTASQVERLVVATPPQSPSVARLRVGHPRIQARQLRGDVDGIVLRCLRKDPHERYASVEQLENDIGNYLDGLPVRARGGQRWYRAQKFLGRNKAAVAAAVLVALSLVGGIVAFATQARIAGERAAELHEVARFQAAMLASVDPTKAGGMLTADVAARLDAALRKRGVSEADRRAQVARFRADWTLVNATDAAGGVLDGALLKPAADAIATQFAGQPVVVAALRQGLADSYSAMGRHDAAVPLHASALELRRRHLGAGHPDTVHSLASYARSLDEQGHSERAEALYREVVARRRVLLGETHADTLRAINELGDSLVHLGRLDEAEPLFRGALETASAALGPDHEVAFMSLNNIGFVLRAQGRLDEAEPYFRESLERRRRVLGEDNELTLIAYNNMGLLASGQGRISEAAAYFRIAADGRRRVLGETHADTAVALHNVGSMLRTLGRVDEAAPVIEEAARLHVQSLGEDHPRTLLAMTTLGNLRVDQARHVEAETILTDTYARRLRVNGDASGESLWTLRALAGALRKQGRDAEALALLEPSEAAARSAFTGTNAHKLGSYLLTLGQVRAALHRREAAESTLTEAHAILVDSHGARPNAVSDCIDALLALYDGWHAADPDGGWLAKSGQWSVERQRLGRR